MAGPKREVIGGDPLIGIEEIAEILPHRYPFLLVDRVLEMDLEKNTITAQKNVTFNELFFQGHFPGMPIMPGVLAGRERTAVASAVMKMLRGADWQAFTPPPSTSPTDARLSLSIIAA